MDKDNNPTAAGVYIARIRYGKFTKTMKMNKIDGGGTYVNEGVHSGSNNSRRNFFKSLVTTDPDMYDFTVERAGYNKFEATEGISENQHFEWNLEKEITTKTIRMYVVDNQTLTPTKGKIEFNNEVHDTDDNGFLEVEINSAITNLDELKAYTVNETGEANSFVQTYKNVAVNQDLPLAAMVTTYTNLTDVEECLQVSPELFRDFMQEGNMRQSTAPAHGLRSIDFQNASLPREEGGYVYWIDSDYASQMIPQNYGTFSEDEQLHIKEVIEREVLSHIRDATHKPNIYIAQPGEELPLKQSEAGLLKPDDGIIFVTHRLDGNGYQFRPRDYDNYGTINAATVMIGDPTNVDEGITQEA